MNFKKESIKNIKVEEIKIDEAKEMMKRLINECESELNAVVGVSKKLSFDGTSIDFHYNETGEFNIECFLVIKHYNDERWESREEYYVHTTRKEDNKEWLDDHYSGYNIYTKEDNIKNANDHIEEFLAKYAEPGDVHLPFFSIYSV